VWQERDDEAEDRSILEEDMRDETLRLMQAGPRSRAIFERRQKFMRGVGENSGCDPDSHLTWSAMDANDCREKVFTIPKWESETTIQEIDEKYGLILMPTEFDTLSLLRMARNEGYESPYLVTFEAAAFTAGRIDQ
jgi:hypothetical protein